MFERMLDKSVIPEFSEMTAWCGTAGELFVRLNTWLFDTLKTQSKVVFPYGNHYGWGMGHYQKKKLWCNVFPETGAFTVMLRLSNQQFVSVYEGLQPETQEIIDHKYPCGDGGWIHYRVTNEAAYADICTLLKAKGEKK